MRAARARASPGCPRMRPRRHAGRRRRARRSRARGRGHSRRPPGHRQQRVPPRGVRRGVHGGRVPGRPRPRRRRRARVARARGSAHAVPSPPTPLGKTGSRGGPGCGRRRGGRGAHRPFDQESPLLGQDGLERHPRQRSGRVGLELPGKLADAVAERGGGRGAIFVSGGLGTLVERHERMRHGARMAGAQALPRQAAVEAIRGVGDGISLSRYAARAHAAETVDRPLLR
jgi:hypothetical protein